MALRREVYVAPSRTWDHVHCAFCWRRFTDFPCPDAIPAGYVWEGPHEDRWICPGCYDDFHEEFGWTLE